MRIDPDNVYAAEALRPSLSYQKPEKEPKKNLLFKRLFNPLSLVFLITLSTASATAIALFGMSTGVIIAAVIIGIPLVYAVITYPEFGIIVLLIAAYFIMFFLRMIKGYPLGIIMDALQLLMIFGFLLKQKYQPNWKILRSPISTMILIWFAYNLLQVGNPYSESRMAWLYTVRTVAVVTLMYFIFSYYIRSVEFIRLIFKLWMALSVFAALYAIKQEYFGFFAFEEEELKDPLIQLLLYINGTWRKFSIFSDPVAFAYNMVISSLFCLAMLKAPISRKAKIIYGCMAALFLTVMLYSGTRGAYVLVPAALVLFVIMHINKKTFFLAAIGGFLFLVLINIPTSNPTLYRFQSAFKPSDDASFNVRKRNQKMIQPYIQAHPFGGGLGATGVWGVRFAPNSYLANFPPDSGYVRVAVELGSVGLLIFCIMMFTFLRQGVLNYYAIRDPELKTYCLAMVLVVFALNIGNFPQEALVQYPTNVYFYLFVALINITLRLDQEKAGELSPQQAHLLSA